RPCRRNSLHCNHCIKIRARVKPNATIISGLRLRTFREATHWRFIFVLILCCVSATAEPPENARALLRERSKASGFSLTFRIRTIHSTPDSAQSFWYVTVMRLGHILKLCLLVSGLVQIVGANERNVYVIPVREGVSKPLAYLVRRGVKQALEAKADL